MNRFLYLPILLFTAFLVAGGSRAADLQSATSQVEKSHEELLDLNDDTVLLPQERLKKEIAARKNIITDALALSLQEISNLKDSLKELPQFPEDSREDALRQGFMADLDKFEDYYISKEEELSKTTFFMLDAVKNFAKTIVDYRDTIYNPKTADIVDFTLLFYNEDAIATAKTRLSKIMTDIKKLEKLNILKVGYFQTSLNESTELLDESTALNLEARTLILGYPAKPTEEASSASGSPEQEGLSEPAPQKAGDKEENALLNEAAALPEAGDLLIQSLGNIKSAYEIFVTIGKETQKILGIR